METEQQHLSKRLQELIYNPVLSFRWKKWKPYDKLLMFHALFLTLNKDFQEEFGQLFDALIPVYLSDMKEAEVYPEPLSRRRERLHAEKMIFQYSSKIEELPFTPREICAFLFKEDIPPFISMLDIKGIEHDFHSADINFRNVQERKLYKKELERAKSFSFGSVYESLKEENFEKYAEARKQGIVTPIIYPAVCIYKPKLQIEKDFKRYLDKMKQSYIDNHDTEDFFFTKHTSASRIQSYRFNDWARYYQSFIYRELGKKNKEIAKIFFPKDDLESAQTKTTKDILKAKKLIENAWLGDFPGKYS